MSRHIPSFLLILGALLFSAMALSKTRLTGDGGEYLLMTHALLKHGSPAIAAADVADYARMAPARLEVLGLPQALLGELLRQAQASKPDVVGAAFFPDAAGRYYSLHFWLYSLLALPFYALIKPLGLNPAAAFVLLNFACAGGVFAYLRRAVPRLAPLAFLVFLAAGTSFYLRWTGPEVMSASCALGATLAMLRGQAGLAILLAGVGASQNPPLLFMMPFVVVFRYWLARWPALRWPGEKPPPRPGKAAMFAALAGAGLALAPMAFFQLSFGVPSLIAKYMASTELVTPQRFLSLYLDLDQGMIVGVPALFLAFLLAPLLLAPGQRRAWLSAAAFTVAMIVVMSVPALSATNWNSGCSVFVRYAYWLAMPLLALALRASVAMAPGRAWALLLATLLGQAAVLSANGIFGQDASYMRHSAAVQWLLEHHPAIYNPDAEIFVERDAQREIRVTPDLVHVHRAGGKPVKLLRHWSNFESSGGLCPQGQLLQAGSTENIDGGWQYLDSPFTCAAGGTAATLAWRFGDPQGAGKGVLDGGWSAFEGTGLWSDGKVSGLRLPLPPGRQALRLRLQGFYYASQRATEVSVNGHSLGKYKLPNEAIDLPPEVRGAAVLSVTLRHPGAESPKARGESTDERMLGFFLQTAVIDTSLAPSH
jgi:hypothetical protein